MSRANLLVVVWLAAAGTSMAQTAPAEVKAPALKWEAESARKGKTMKEDDATPPPPHIRQSIPYRPEPNELTAIDVNPPTFRWPGDWSKPYTVQMKREGQSWGQAVEVKGIKETFLRPLKPLEAGKWEWRVRREGGEWMGPSSFATSADTAQFPIPEWEEIYARFSRKHPRIMVSLEDIPALRAKAEGPMKDFIAKWSTRLGSKVEAELSLAQDKERKDAGGHHEKTIQRVASKKDAGALMGAAGDMAFLAMVLGRDDLKQEAIRRAMAATALDPKGYTSHQVSDFANGAIVKNAGKVYDYLYGQLSPEQRKAIREMIHARLFQYKPNLEQRPYSAHGWQHIMGDLAMGAMAIWDEDPQAFEWLKWNVKMFVAFYPWYGGADGGSAEGASYYGGTNLTTSLEFRELWRRVAGIDLAAKPWFRANPYFLIYSHAPGQPLSQFADHPASLAPPSQTKAIAAALMADWYDNPYAAGYAREALAGSEKNEGKADKGEGSKSKKDGGAAGKESGDKGKAADLQDVNWGNLSETFLIEGPLGKVKPRPLSELPHGHVFRDVGVAYIHSAIDEPQRNVLFEFRSSPYAGFNHAHADQNSFNITAFGEYLIVDSGYYTSFGDEHHSGWTVQTKAHNTILVDGHGQPSRNTDAYGRIVGFEQGGDWAWVAGEAGTAYREPALGHFRRQAVWIKGEEVQTYVIFDSIAAKDGKPHQYGWLLHTEVKPAIEAEAQRCVVPGAKGQARVSWLAPKGLAVSLTDKFDPPAVNWRLDKQKYNYKNQWHLTAAPKENTAAHVFVAVIQVTKTGAKVDLPAPALGAEGDITIGKARARFREQSIDLSIDGKTVLRKEMSE